MAKKTALKKPCAQVDIESINLLPAFLNHPSPENDEMEQVHTHIIYKRDNNR